MHSSTVSPKFQNLDLNFQSVASIPKEWGVEGWVERNLLELYRRNRIRIMNDYKMAPGIEERMPSEHGRARSSAT